MKHIAVVFLALAVVLAATGCASSKTDWNSRLGVYSYDQAVTDLGPPDKEAVLSDGSKVAEWLTSRGSSGGFVSTYAPYPVHRYPYRGYYGRGFGTYYEPGSPDYFLRLVFDPAGKLREWKKVSK